MCGSIYIPKCIHPYSIYTYRYVHLFRLSSIVMYACNMWIDHRALFIALDESDRQLQDSITWWKLIHMQFVR